MSSKKYLPLYEIAMDKLKVRSYGDNVENKFKKLKQNVDNMDMHWKGKSYESFRNALIDLESDIRSIVKKMDSLEYELGKAYNKTKDIIEEERLERLRKLEQERQKKLEEERKKVQQQEK